MKHTLLSALTALGVAGILLGAQPVTVTVDLAHPGARINPAMWGVFFEDINYGADGGLYAELVKNRSFEFPQPLMGWSEVKVGAATGQLSVTNCEPASAANPNYLQIHAGTGGFGVANDSFFGIGVRKGETYRFSMLARNAESGATVVCACGQEHWGLLPPPLRVELVGANGSVLASARIKGFGSKWEVKTAKLRPIVTDSKARLRLILEQGGTLDVDMVSLFPAKTWKDRPNGLRADVVKLLADMKPGFVRFPGGCIVEGRYLNTRYQWKTTIGPVADRKLIINRWNDEFKHRPAPDYFQSFGLGFFEYFQMCEDIGAQPLPILNCGMACQFNSNELVPLDQLDPFIQDALDLIEFANGPADSTWGAKRAAMGHSKPFNMRLLGVGNEQWGPQYVERLERFTRVLKARHPEIQLIASAGPRPDDDLFQYLWPKLRELKADIVDEHCYATPDWFLNNTRRYDNYDRNGPKVFMGEYAAQSVKVVSPDNRNNLECALAEAAYMTGLERNASVVAMSAYAPLFAHEEGWQWRPNLIWFDNLNVYGTPSYYVQKLFSLNRGDVVLPATLAGAVPSASNQPRFYASAVRDENAGEIIVKAVNASAEPVPADIGIVGARYVAKEGRVNVLTSASLADENSILDPAKVAPTAGKFKTDGSRIAYTFAPQSLTVLRLKAGAAK